ncbi:MAG: hypothetical protein EAZ60_02075 [Oscillatoriales cyanobacterium]|nr:MAG: hypothetical protein EAZ83_09330 [Oscillatoriales cyanobacterium]TAE95156.1 MAG: hypothetical protein EAZ79_20160 [Oscillatoriales cyanobacterium]TAF23611.1 MAG: hypothetical protein EAZ73_01870 [Oscillatoriales cyanobacterium]TAF30495.1 MAG: hypothetical protein EAZ69_22135 [Oscillatoriales cyanobacterium]TAF58663.1 MAG: hypothetical protein EAZ60_02075 [Oscillatoriales cyanobacterium]
MGWASRPSIKDGRDAHPTIIKIVSYLIVIPYRQFNRSAPDGNGFINKHNMMDCLAIFYLNGISSTKQAVTQRHKMSDINHRVSLIQEILASHKLEILLLIKEWQKPWYNSHPARTRLSAVV